MATVNMVEGRQMWRALEFYSRKRQAVEPVFVSFVMVHEKVEVQLVLVETAVLAVMTQQLNSFEQLSS